MSQPDAPAWVAYLNWGRWVADCPRPCGSAVQLTAGQDTAVCAGTDACGWTGPVRWPRNVKAIEQAMRRRPADRSRNWFPEGHPVAVAGHMPHGQSVADLDAETDEYANRPAAPPDRRQQIEQALAGFGLGLTEDGQTLRSLE